MDSWTAKDSYFTTHNHILVPLVFARGAGNKKVDHIDSIYIHRKPKKNALQKLLVESWTKDDDDDILYRFLDI